MNSIEEMESLCINLVGGRIDCYILYKNMVVQKEEKGGEDSLINLKNWILQSP